MSNQEIDKLIATKIMGWNIHSRNADEWKPTQNIGQAIQTLEEIQLGLNCRIDIHIRDKTNNRVWTGNGWERKRYAVAVSGGNIGYDDPNCSFTVYDDSICMAACQAALRADKQALEELED
jgi:hypothetical protein